MIPSIQDKNKSVRSIKEQEIHQYASNKIEPWPKKSLKKL